MRIRHTKKLLKEQFLTSRVYRIIFLQKEYPCYWDDGIKNYHSKEWNISHVKRKNKEITLHEYREFRTWKYNRRTQYK